MSDDPQRGADGERVPEQSVTPAPGTAPTKDHRTHGDWGNQQADIAKNRQCQRMIAKEPPDCRVPEDVAEANEQIDQSGTLKLWERLTLTHSVAVRCSRLAVR